MGTDGAKGNHYNQIGYNYHGKEAANNLFGVVYNGLETATGIELIDRDGLTRLTPENTVEVKATATYRLGALPLPHYVDEKITWTTSNKYVATVDSFGVVKGVSVGTATITATTESGKQQSVTVNVYETNAEHVSYRWDFNDLTDSVGGNDLTHYSGEYVLEDGICKKSSSSDDYNRVTFALETPIELNESMDWSIEWKGYIKGGSTFLGQLPDENATGLETANHIYCSPYANWGSSTAPKYCIKFQPSNRSNILLPYTEYKDAMTVMNSWRIVYTAADNQIKLYLSTDDGATWTETCSVTAGAFTLNANSLLGRTRHSGQYNYNGELDYIAVDCYKFTKVTEKNGVTATYRWDFDDLTDSIGGNDLTLNPACPEKAATRYTLANGVYSVSTSTPDL